MNSNRNIVAFIYFFITLTLGCTNNRCSIHSQTNGQLTLLDSFDHAEHLRPYSAYDKEGYYPVYYMGEVRDTIFLSKPINRYRDEQTYDKSACLTFNYRSTMKMMVDTHFNLTHTIHYDHYTEKEERFIPDSTKRFKAFPVFVYNISDSFLHLGIFDALHPLIRQAKNEQGQWIDIETPIYFGCATGSRDIILKPHQVAIAMTLRYEGEYKTECRLAYRNQYGNPKDTVYSNVFVDYIDKRQLTDKLKSN